LSALLAISSGTLYTALAMLPVVAASVSLSPPKEMAVRIASSKSVLSRNAIIAYDCTEHGFPH